MLCVQDGDSVLMWAASSGKAEAVKVLIEAGVDVTRTDNVTYCSL